MRVGFTGTQRGMTGDQAVGFIKTLQALIDVVEFHHGDCVGADAQAHELVRMFYPNVKIVIHPPDVDAKRAFKMGDTMLDPEPYLDRNQTIVSDTDALIAAPAESDERQRSGTWATVRAARRQKRHIYYLFP